MSYVFDPKVLQGIAGKGLGLPRQQMFEVITEELAARYPGYISEEPE